MMGWMLAASDVASELAQATAEEEHLLWPVLLVAMTVTAVCCWLHFESLQGLIRLSKRFTHTARQAVMMTVLALILLHLVEIMFFALAYAGLHYAFGNKIGHIAGNFNGTVADVVYFSFTAYTTVGYGDLYPVGAIRLLTGVEALAGLVFITWSASFTFLIMQSHYETLTGQRKKDK